MGTIATPSLTPRDDAPALQPGIERAGKYLIFGLGDEEFGASVLNVREIMAMHKITPVPQMPEYVRGVMNLRGKVVPVLDLRLRFGMSAEPYTERTCIILVRSLLKGIACSVGIIVDRVSEVVMLTAGEIEDMPEVSSGQQSACLLGLAKSKGRLRILLELDELLSGDDLPVLPHLQS